MRSVLRVNEKYNPKRNSRARGFTIWELIVTLGILAILIMIAIPSFNRIADNGNLKTAARDLIADLNALREKAMAENTQFDLTFNGDTYTCAGLPNGQKTTTGVASDIHIFNAPQGMLSFYTRGILSQPGTITLINNRNSTAEITCKTSGRIYVQFNWN